jgi:endonuclease G
VAAPVQAQRPRGWTPSPTDYADRPGYDPTFLGALIPLPQLTPAALRFGTPAPVAGSDDDVLRYIHYAVVLNATRRLATVTAVNIDGARWINLERGRDVWRFDPRVARELQLGDEFYGNEGDVGRKGWFDRGHLVRRLDPVWGELALAAQANDDTFHFTNCAPQYWGFNQGEELWQGLENFLLYNTDAEDGRASVFTGPVFGDADEVHRGVAIPQFFWKVIVVRDRAGTLFASAYVVSQERYARDIPFERLPVGTFNNFQVPLTTLEARTGLNFGDTVRAADVLRSGSSDVPLRSLGDIQHPRR